MEEASTETYIVKIRRDTETGRVLQQAWYRDGALDNPFGEPAVTNYDVATGKVSSEFWMASNTSSRPEDDGPAIIHYDPESGIAVKEAYFLNGKIHRISGPAAITRNALGEVLSQSYFQFGQAIDNQQLRNDL